MAAYREAIDAAIARRRRGRRGRRRLPPPREPARALLRRASRRPRSAARGIDFEDLQILAARLLERAELGGAYRARFSHLLVDEFQDTNRLAAAADRGAARARDSELIMVGDELQSIYGFRHADLDVFREQRRRVERGAGAQVIELSGNFRSRPEVIGAVNEIGGAAARREYRPLRVGRAAGAAGPSGRRARRSSCC